MKYRLAVDKGIMKIVEISSGVVVCVGLNKWKLIKVVKSLNDGKGFGGQVPMSLWSKPLVIL